MKFSDKTFDVWIELPNPASHAHAIELCDLANKMVRRLGVEVGTEGVSGFGWDAHRHQYTFGSGGHSYIGLKNRGAWFNLKFLAGDEA
jgi:hypothetical protein